MRIMGSLAFVALVIVGMAVLVSGCKKEEGKAEHSTEHPTEKTATPKDHPAH